MGPMLVGKANMLGTEVATLKHHSTESREAHLGDVETGGERKGRAPVVMTCGPNDVTVAAMEELEAGRGERFDSVDALFDDLGV